MGWFGEPSLVGPSCTLLMCSNVAKCVRDKVLGWLQALFDSFCSGTVDALEVLRHRRRHQFALQEALHPRGMYSQSHLRLRSKSRSRPPPYRQRCRSLEQCYWEANLLALPLPMCDRAWLASSRQKTLLDMVRQFHGRCKVGEQGMYSARIV
jgi:hypothetical protein